MICAGIDAGSRAIKVALVDSETRRMVANGIADQGVEQTKLSERLLNDVLHEAGVKREDVGRIVATGYGRNIVETADTTITEITCHGRGVFHLESEARTIIDIGGQDSKVLRLESGGAVRDFSMNDRCAAGTGRFLEVVAERLGVAIEELGRLAESSRAPATISSMCVVFAETEIIGLLASGTAPEDIVAGVQSAIATRINAMAGRGVEEPVLFTGGVALVPGMKEALARALGHVVSVSPEPQYTGAYGAALIACEQIGLEGR